MDYRHPHQGSVPTTRKEKGERDYSASWGESICPLTSRECKSPRGGRRKGFTIVTWTPRKHIMRLRRMEEKGGEICVGGGEMANAPAGWRAPPRRPPADRKGGKKNTFLKAPPPPNPAEGKGPKNRKERSTGRVGPNCDSFLGGGKIKPVRSTRHNRKRAAKEIERGGGKKGGPHPFQEKCQGETSKSPGGYAAPNRGKGGGK